VVEVTAGANLEGERKGFPRLKGKRAVLRTEILAVLDYAGRVGTNSHDCLAKFTRSTKNCFSVSFHR